MKIELTESQKAFIQQGIESGRYRDAEDAIRNALALWEERERQRLEILQAVQVAEAEIARGEGRVISSEEQSAQLAEEIKERGLRRFATL